MNNPYTSNILDDSHDDTDQATDPLIGKAVGLRLASLFTEFPEEDVPNRLAELIDQLEHKEQAAEGTPRPA